MRQEEGDAMGKRPGQAISAWIRPLRYCWKPIALLWVGIIFGIFCSTFAAWLITKHKLWDVSDTPLGWLRDHLAIVLPLAGALLVFTGLAGLATFQAAKQHAVQAAPLSSLPPARAQQNRARMRERLAQWYLDFLVASLGLVKK